jgi:hypothetical protein
MGTEQDQRAAIDLDVDSGDDDAIADEQTRTATRTRPLVDARGSAREQNSDAHELRGTAAERPSMRPSARPSAFGPPRASQIPPAPESSRASIPPRGVPVEARGSAREQHEEQGTPTGPRRRVRRDADTGERAVGREPSDEAGATAASFCSRADPRASTQPPPGSRTSASQPPAARAPASQPPAWAAGNFSDSKTFRADLEELLPLVSTRSSIPPTLPALPELTPRRARGTQDPRWTRFSLAIFGVVLAASILPLARYTGVLGSLAPRGSAPAIQVALPAASSGGAPAAPGPAVQPMNPTVSQEPFAVPAAAALPADPMLAALEKVERELVSDPVQAADQLLAQGLRALAAGDPRFAEALLGRALKLDDDNPRAYYGLAQIRLAQGNLQGAEGWIVAALRKRPRRAEYHALYAKLLDALGRPAEAQAARAKAAQLRKER